MSRNKIKTEQEALELFCNHFNLYIDSMDYHLTDGFYCRLKAYNPPFKDDSVYCREYETFHCYISEFIKDNGSVYLMKDMNNMDSVGKQMELYDFIRYIENMLFTDGWKLTKQKDKYIWYLD